jgi:hypothetical protein
VSVPFKTKAFVYKTKRKHTRHAEHNLLLRALEARPGGRYVLYVKTHLIPMVDRGDRVLHRVSSIERENHFALGRSRAMGHLTALKEKQP